MHKRDDGLIYSGLAGNFMGKAIFSGVAVMISLGLALAISILFLAKSAELGDILTAHLVVLELAVWTTFSSIYLTGSGGETKKRIFKSVTGLFVPLVVLIILCLMSCIDPVNAVAVWVCLCLQCCSITAYLLCWLRPGLGVLSCSIVAFVLIFTPLLSSVKSADLTDESPVAVLASVTGKCHVNSLVSGLDCGSEAIGQSRQPHVIQANGDQDSTDIAQQSCGELKYDFSFKLNASSVHVFGFWGVLLTCCVTVALLKFNNRRHLLGI